mmetsp:Transcript_22801/g.22024  ORF Transcript_22801/g.22024 Transcript_22801/m.22024 type:complete len:195 (+) Transcript_22801:135-719(+)
MDDVINKFKMILNSGAKRDLLLVALLMGAVFIFCFTICSLVVSGTANVGFNIVLTAFLNIAYIAGSYYVITNSKTPIAIGFLIGVTATMSALNFMTAIYWGQLSKCTMGIVAKGYSCTNPSAYGAVCAFAVFIFLLQSAICIALIVWRDELIGNESSDNYDDVTSNSFHLSGGGYENLKGGSSSIPSATTSADL